MNEKFAKIKKIPFYLCSLTLEEIKDPVCLRSGDVFDIKNLIPYIEKYKKNPITGEPIQIKEIIRMKFFKNSKGEYNCPVSKKILNENTKICVIKNTGNVFAYETIKNLNIEGDFWEDLIDGKQFKRSDIIIIQDPHDYYSKNIQNFDFIKKNLHHTLSRIKSSGRKTENQFDQYFPSR